MIKILKSLFVKSEIEDIDDELAGCSMTQRS